MMHYIIPVILLIMMVGCGGCGGKESTSQTPVVDGGDPLLNNTTISWDAPTTNSDGSPLTPPLAGYKVYYAQKIGSGSIVFGNVTTIPDANATSATFKDHTGTYCYAVTAYNTAWDESDYSNIVSKTVNNGTISYGTCQ